MRPAVCSLLLPWPCKDLQLQINKAEDVLMEPSSFFICMYSASCTPSKIVDEVGQLFVLTALIRVLQLN